MSANPNGPWGTGDYLVKINSRRVLSGFGYMRPLNPFDFKPDKRLSTEIEKENHKAACIKYERENGLDKSH